MRLSVLNQSQASAYTPQGKSAIIRISDSVDSLPELDYPYDMVLSMGFYDIKYARRMPVNWNMFSNHDASMIVDFFDRLSQLKYDELVIHCGAGVSRSPAVAIAWAWYTEDDAVLDAIMKAPVAPNTLVLKKLAQKMGIYQEKKKWIRDLEQAIEEASMRDESKDVEF